MSFYRQITPSNEPYDNYLVWLAPNGAVRNYFFSHTNGSVIESVKNYNIETLSDVRSIPEEGRFSFKIYSRFIDLETYQYVSSILFSNRIIKVLLDGTEIPVFIKAKSMKRGNKSKSFSINFEISPKEENILNV